MISPRYRILITVIPMIVAGWLLVTVLCIITNDEHFLVGVTFGTIFGQVTAAATWIALGPGPLIWRLALSPIWVAAFTVPLVIDLTDPLESNVSDGFAFHIYFFGQWLAIQIPLWSLAIAYGWQLERRETGQMHIPGSRQFGIRHLLVVTAEVAAFLGVGRAIFGSPSDYFHQILPIETDIVLVMMASVVVSLPLVTAALLPMFAVRSVLLVLMLISIATALELPLMQRFAGITSLSIDHIIWINVFNCAWVLAFVLATRLSGYGLVRRTRNAANPVAPSA